MEIESVKKHIISHIKNKKELKNLDDFFVQEYLDKYLQQNKTINFQKYSSTKQLEKSSSYKELISIIRSELRTIYGVFIRNDLNKFEKKLNIITSKDDELIDEILNSHQSSFERFMYYEILYKYIFEKLFDLGLDKKFTIIDLACGANPFAYKFLPIEPEKYFASDLSSKDMHLINIFFKNSNINGFAKNIDLLNLKEVEKFISNIHSKNKVCFLFKALDSIEVVKRHSSKRLLSQLNCDYYVVSFPTKTIGGKKSIPDNKRNWFENFIKKTFSQYITHQIENEFFYIIKK